MANYYFLAASLPPLELGHRAELTFEELASRLALNLKAEDLAKTVVFRRLIDIANIRLLFLEEAIDPRGNYDEKELDEALLLQVGLPDYVFDFLDQFTSTSEKVRNFVGVFARFFSQEISDQTGFLKDYFEFERAWRLIMVALKSKELGLDAVIELQFEDFKDPLVAQILAQKDSAEYEPPAEYADLKQVYLSCGKDPWQQYKAVAKWRFDRIEQLVNKPLFSIDWILAYMAQLVIVEHYNELDVEKGKIILDSFVG